MATVSRPTSRDFWMKFTPLQQLQDVSKPDIVFEVVSPFFEDSEKLLNELATALSQQCAYFKKIDAHVHQLKGSSSSLLNDVALSNCMLPEIEEVRANKKWMCPRCIENKGIRPYLICNSSLWLKKRKMAPTGIAIFEAREMV
ncbi:hypothetical protein MKW98_023657 [Papaver atlanticum]|uniref:Histidine-containing phosphotransfer protein n=1 Tax=Papaver atlanticum TaxID=357466 RepID=A0AAD4XN96_9MAGN|nr:hypothetical protein MKW98_023657 [Papaver atlanticum]